MVSWFRLKVFEAFLVAFSMVPSAVQSSTTACFAANAGKPSNGSNSEKRITFVRHGCTYMNEYLGRTISFGAPNFSDIFNDHAREEFYKDSPLSRYGIQQAERYLAQKPPSFVHDCELVVTSPLTRAIQTLEIGLKPHLSKSIPIVALPHAAERLYLISDVGKTRSTLESMPNLSHIDFKTGFQDHPEEWWYQPKSSETYAEWRPSGKGQRYACPGEPDQAFDCRMQSLVSWLKERPEQKIAVVCHWGVIDWMLDLDFDNCQWREVPFSSLRQHAAARNVRNA